MTASIKNSSERIFPTVIEELAQKFDKDLALLSEEESQSYRGLAERSRQYARWALDQGIVNGKTACLLMPNASEYLAIWIGITSVGGVVALLNTGLIGPSLAHCIEAAEAKHVIVAGELVDEVVAVRPHLHGGHKIWVHGDGPAEFMRIDQEVDGYSHQKLTDAERPLVTIHHPALHIYTSGTTGLPKAAIISHYRIMQWSYWFAGMMDTLPSDRMYNCLPMFHSIGGVVAIGSVLVNGGSIVFRKKFSAGRFWDDIFNTKCTLFQYIGELCRYLTNMPPHPLETAHQIRLCCGNGLRRRVWNEFQSRFKIPQILEFYAATEGNVALYNVEGVPGSIGRIPAFLGHRHPLALLRFDPEKEVPIRNEEGFCIPCVANEVGEAVGRIDSVRSSLAVPFDGYTNKQETEIKILRNVFRPGDAWFRTGDLMREDDNGNFYFIDRIGDTFRWKGENVSSAEVAEALAAFSGVLEANVYGVVIPGVEGRAGMAALVINAGFDLADLPRFMATRLPLHARPVFLRICETITVTATFKYNKQEFVRQGYNPAATRDLLFVRDHTTGIYRQIDPALYEKIQCGDLRL